MNGYFLEPAVDYDSARIEGSKKAILGGKYRIVPKQYETQRFQWYLKGVDGRTGIAIHKGTNGTDSKGCLIPGTSYSYDSDNNEYKVWKSGAKLEELTKFIKIKKAFRHCPIYQILPEYYPNEIVRYILVVIRE